MKTTQCSACGSTLRAGLDAQGLCPRCLLTTAASMTPSLFDEGAARIGARIATYDIVAALGHGRRGVVYRAFDTTRRRTVALKVMSNVGTDDDRDRLLREARLATRLIHPNICAIDDVVDVEGVVCIVMEYVEGKPLAEAIPIHGLPIHLVLDYGRQIADAVGHAHAQGIVHRGLKNGRVLVTTDGAVKVLGFGLARPYTAPETLRGEPPDARTDVWALGVMLYEMATGALPFRGRTPLELRSAVLHDVLSPLPAGVPDGLADTIARCLAKDPRDRYQDGDDVRTTLSVGSKEPA